MMTETTGTSMNLLGLTEIFLRFVQWDWEKKCENLGGFFD